MEDFKKLLGWADEAAKQEVWANADTPEDARRAREFGAKGIGLCRTEHMFMATDRLFVMQRLVVAEFFEERVAALDKLYTSSWQIQIFIPIRPTFVSASASA